MQFVCSRFEKNKQTNKQTNRYARHQDPQLLRNILQHVNDIDGQGDFATYKALAAVVPEQRARMLTAAAEYYAKSKTGAALKVRSDKIVFKHFNQKKITLKRMPAIMRSS